MSAETEPPKPAETTADRRILRAFDAAAREQQPSELEHLVPGSKRASIADVRQQPFESVGLVLCQGATSLYGTAVYCAPDAVVTAKHTFNVADIKSAWIYIGFDAKKNPGSPAKVMAIAMHPNLDLAVLVIDAPPRTPLQFPGVRAAIGQQLVVAGYGVPYGDGSMQITTGSGAVTESTDQLLGYAITTDSGDSGAPVLARTPQGEFVVVAIHTSGDTGLPSGSNFGIPMTPSNVAELTKLLALARQRVPH